MILSPTDVTIRKARPSDRPVLHRLLTESWMANWAPHVRPASVARFQAEDPVAAELDACLSEMEVAEVGGRLLGVLHRTEDKIESLHVDELHKRQGIGSALLAHAEADGAWRLDVRAFNADAIGFYERHGWRRVGEYESSELGTPCTTFEYHRPS